MTPQPRPQRTASLPPDATTSAERTPNIVWIMADEVYARLIYTRPVAPSFLELAEPEDPLIVLNSFSKPWAMTGWRVGWLKIHPELQQVFENLIQYSTSGTPAFLQKGAVAALDEGDEFLKSEIAAARIARDTIAQRLLATGRVELTVPPGAFYLFFRIDSIRDTRRAAFEIVDEANVGLAPGTAFGPGGEEFFRLCFHRRLDLVEEAADRLARWIESR